MVLPVVAIRALVLLDQHDGRDDANDDQQHQRTEQHVHWLHAAGLKAALAGQYVLVEVDAEARVLVVYHGQEVVKRVRLQGVRGELVACADFLELMRAAARSDWRAWVVPRRAAVA